MCQLVECGEVLAAAALLQGIVMQWCQELFQLTNAINELNVDGDKSRGEDMNWESRFRH